MQSEDVRIVCIMRRRARKHTSGTKGFYLRDASPEELIFELLDPEGRRTGQIEYKEYQPDSFAKASTPWGQATVMTGGGYIRSGERGFLTLILGDRAVINMTPHMLRWDFAFPNEIVIPFKMHPGRYSLSYSGDMGTVRVLQEEGETPEAGKFHQWTILVSGIAPTYEQDVVASLAVFASLECLDFENLYGA